VIGQNGGKLGRGRWTVRNGRFVGMTDDEAMPWSIQPEACL